MQTLATLCNYSNIRARCNCLSQFAHFVNLPCKPSGSCHTELNLVHLYRPDYDLVYDMDQNQNDH